MLTKFRYPSFNRPFNRNGVVVFPFHDACYSLLLRVISRYIEGSVDEEILYAVFVQLGNGHKPWILDIDYGDPAPKSNPKTFGLFPRDPTVHHDWWKNYGHEVIKLYRYSLWHANFHRHYLSTMERQLTYLPTLFSGPSPIM